jgi:hypothetical protein
MFGDFFVNIIAGIALLALGFVSRHVVTRFRTRATRRLWRSSVAEGLTIALSTRKGRLPRSGTRTGFSEVRALLALIPMLSQIRVPYTVTESLISTASQITNKHILLIGGPNSNELSKAALSLTSLQFQIGDDPNARSFTIFDHCYESTYSSDKSLVEEDYGVVVRTVNPFSSDSGLTATLVMGSHRLGTGGAAQLLVDEHLIRRVAAQVTLSAFLVVVRVRSVGNEYAVKLEAVHAL